MDRGCHLSRSPPGRRDDDPPRLRVLTLRDVPELVHVTCGRCGRAGQYRRETLLQRFGPDRALPDVLVALAACPRYLNASDPCGAAYIREGW